MTTTTTWARAAALAALVATILHPAAAPAVKEPFPPFQPSATVTAPRSSAGTPAGSSPARWTWS
ncbi:hypothetical protein AB0K40_00485 [Nonomuraea bangladeshensis]|uniref:Uncharacterized protein n=1 Tax=Nonomuraea bangladeshensis TaxID=404385 RepID=A0ABV3GUK5_9ACTN